MLQAILFDMDGVLIDSEIEYLAQQIRIGKELGIEFDEHELKKYMGVSTHDTWADIRNKYNLEVDSKELAERELKRMDAHYESGDLHPIVDSIDLLKRCREYELKTAIATSTFKNNAYLVASRLELNTYVGAIATGCMTTACKPDPDIFLLAAEMLGTPPQDCIVIEDSYSGLKAAKSAGMGAVVLARDGEKFDTTLADKVVKSCSELDLKALNQIHLSNIEG